jgi:hypothetical protein
MMGSLPIFDFLLEDDIFNEDAQKRNKSKTEFVKRDPHSTHVSQ